MSKLNFSLNIEKHLSKIPKEELLKIKKTLCEITSILHSEKSISKKANMVRKIILNNNETKKILIISIKNALWDESSLPIKIGLASFIGASLATPGLNLGIATAGMGIGVSVAIAAGILGVFVGSIIQEINQRIESRNKVCPSCNEDLFNWKGWPIKDKFSKIEVTSEQRCVTCNISTVKLSDLIWENVHGPYSTGLPDYWKISKSSGNDSHKKWGKPITYLKECGTCNFQKTLISHSHEGSYEQCNCVEHKKAS